jgi:carbonic anhydrase
MKPLHDMLAFNRRWAAERTAEDPHYFERHADGQTPDTLLIGCSDSRVPITNITGVDPGQMFVHRNIANQVHASDLNVQSVIAYAVDALQVGHILVTGHTACGGVKAATLPPRHGIVDHWLGPVRFLWKRHRDELSALPTDEARLGRLVRLNVLLQVYTLAFNPTVHDAWREGRPLALHGLVYDIGTGLLEEVVTGIEDVASARERLAGFDPA